MNNGSGSFLKKDLSKLLMTLRSLHFWNDSREQRDHVTSGFSEGDAIDPATHVIVDVDVVHALVVELFLHVGDGGVVSRDSVDARVLQPPLLHQFAADLHDQRHKLKSQSKKHHL